MVFKGRRETDVEGFAAKYTLCYRLRDTSANTVEKPAQTLRLCRTCMMHAPSPIAMSTLIFVDRQWKWVIRIPAKTKRNTYSHNVFDSR